MQKTQETQVLPLGGDNPLEEGLATHSSILAWRISMDIGAWWATVRSITKSRTWLKWLSTHPRSPTNYKVPGTRLNVLCSLAQFIPTTILAGGMISTLTLQVRKLNLEKLIAQGLMANEWLCRIQVKDMWIKITSSQPIYLRRINR